MPTYDYECDACGHTMELFQGINDPVVKKCPECKKNKLKRLFGAGAAIVFKGSGFYQTDYRSDGYKKAAKADKSSTSSSSKSETKAASKSESKPSKPATPKSDS
ncbi:FmdB family zinc ribbon protein [Novipirellula sp. SH528]|uniref:FmdB family zinc ribbon protein n=1 Tax=Novipirellula sp. SH528 TaxID=3454466 RepID=UPI003FA03CA0